MNVPTPGHHGKNNMNLAGRKILIADDDSNIRTLVQEALNELEERDIELFCASDGKEAIDLTRAHSPEIIILDIMMPCKSGYEVCEEIRKKLNNHNSFIILISARGSEITRKTSERVGANYYIAKPFDPEKLLTVVSEALFGAKAVQNGIGGKL